MVWYIDPLPHWAEYVTYVMHKINIVCEYQCNNNVHAKQHFIIRCILCMHVCIL